MRKITVVLHEYMSDLEREIIGKIRPEMDIHERAFLVNETYAEMIVARLPVDPEGKSNVSLVDMDAVFLGKHIPYSSRRRTKKLERILSNIAAEENIDFVVMFGTSEQMNWLASAYREKFFVELAKVFGRGNTTFIDFRDDEYCSDHYVTALYVNSEGKTFFSIQRIEPKETIFTPLRGDAFLDAPSLN